MQRAGRDGLSLGYLPAVRLSLWKRLLGEESERIFVRRGAPASASIAASRLVEQRCRLRADAGGVECREFAGSTRLLSEA